MSDPHRIFLIDAHALCYRAFFAVKDLRNSKGQPTNAVFGFVNIIRKILKDYAPDHVAVCFDVSKKTRRQEKYADYKVQRPSMPEDLATQIPIIKEVVAAYRMPILEKEGYEADDIIGTLTQKFRGPGREVVIVTDDKDLCQLIGEGVRIYSSRQDRMIGPEETREKFSVGPERVVDYLALAGDASDNIPGIKGIGEVTAKALLAEHGSLDGILAHAGELKGKLREKVEKGREMALLSRELATLDMEVPLECSLEDLRLPAPDQARLQEIFAELEFRSFLKDVPAAAVPVAQRVAVKDARRDIPGFFEEVAGTKQMSLFLSGDEGDLFAAIFVCAAGDVYRVERDGFEGLSGVLRDPSVLKIVYDHKRVLKFLSGQGLDLAGDILDIFLAGYLLISGQAEHTIEALAWEFLARAVPDNGRAEDRCRALMDLSAPLLKGLKEKGLEDLYRNVELPLSVVLFEIEREGVRLDRALLARLSKDCEARTLGMTEKIHGIAGTPFNVNSPKQLGHVLFEVLKLPVVKKTKTGFSTDEEVLSRLSTEHELPALVLEYRQVMKLRSTYIDALPGLVDERTGRIHCSFNQAGTETGRLSSNHPNLQNIPVRSDLGREIRKAFVASDGRTLVSADYSQIELRVLAHLADEPNLKKAFADGEDIHRYTAGLMFDISPSDVTDEMRTSAKRINFGIIYGISAFGLAKDLGVSQREAQDFIDSYFLRYPGIRTFMDREIEGARARGFVETLFHRRRYLPEINSRNPAVRQFAERQAINTPVQGTAADLIKVAMVRAASEIKGRGFKSRMIITVHDELVFDVPSEERGALITLVKETMESAVYLSVPLEATVKEGLNWAEMKPVPLKAGRI
ncbi:MAG: DNA polymerase I [Elusimicrobia bacterium]|nr:DNA polymerase I [Elusimicrobiota bacterium]